MSRAHPGILNRCLIQRSLQMYMINLANPIPYCSTTLPLKIKVHDRTVPLENVAEQNIQERLSAGCRIFVAYCTGNPVGYIFSALSHCRVAEVERMLHIMPGESYLYDAYTYLEYRGQGVYPCLLSYAARYFQQKNYHYAFIFSLSHNRASLRGIRKAGFTSYGKVEFYKVFGHCFWKYYTDNGHIASHFDNR